jgi:hypothetical protein
MVNDKLCTVCGYEMEEGPRNYNICPSCGTEFGLHDVNTTIDNLRAAWLAGGARWHSTAVPQSGKWNPIQQLSKLLFNQAKIFLVYSDYGLGITTVQVAAGASDPTKFSYTLSELQCM